MVRQTISDSGDKEASSCRAVVLMQDCRLLSILSSKNVALGLPSIATRAFDSEFINRGSIDANDFAL